MSLHEQLILVTPAPVLAGLERLHDGMLGLMEVFCGVLIFGGIAAANMPADEALPQMDPGIAHLQAFLAAFAAGFYLPYLSQMGTGFSWRHFM
jgi:hypothetical protein